MKRLMALLLALLMLCGCGPAPEIPATDPPPVTLAPTEPPAPEEPFKVFGPAEYVDGIWAMGEDLLILTGDETTTLTLHSSQDLSVLASVTLSCYVYTDSPSFMVRRDGITYYDESTRELVFLDGALREQSRMALPEDMFDAPALGTDILCYAVEGQLRVLDLQTGMSRLLKEHNFSGMTMGKLLCDDTVLECYTEHDDGNWSQVFLDLRDGSLLWERYDYVTVHSFGERFFARHSDGLYQEKLLGFSDQNPYEPDMLYCPDPECQAFPLLYRDAVVTSTCSGGSLTLDYYNLTNGSHPYSITFPGEDHPWQVVGSAESEYLWILCYDYDNSVPQLLRWKPEKYPTNDDTAYIGIRRTEENPDTYGLAKVAQKAAQLSEKHGVLILTWTDATQLPPFDYTLVPEYQVSILNRVLDRLDIALSNFPEGFLSDATARMEEGPLKIRLVRGLYGIAEYDTLDSASGIQFWDEEGSNNIALAIEFFQEQNLYHEIYHVIESGIYANSNALDNWEALNPNGFTYDYNYSDYIYRDNIALITGDTQAFIDYYSMSYPKEDRARILEYAMMPDYEFQFQSTIMQQKLKTLCEAIREAYDLDASETYLWEQYLLEE